MPDDTRLSPAVADIAAAARPKMNGFAAGAPVAAVVPRSLGDVAMVAAAIIKAGLTPASYDATGANDGERYERTKARIMVGIMKGAELGMPPITALSAIAMINHRPTIWGDGAVALVQRAGVVAKVESAFEGAPEGDGGTLEDERAAKHQRPRLTDFPSGMTAVCRIWRKGQDIPYEGRFSVQDAMRARLWGNPTRRPWIEYPKRMLMARARAYALRDGFADCLMGLSIREEIEDLPAEAPGKPDTSFLDDARIPAQPGSSSSETWMPNDTRADAEADASSYESGKTTGAPASSDVRRTAAGPEPPPRSALWQAPSYALAVPTKARGRADWRSLYNELLRLIGEAETDAELQQLQRDNKRAIDQIERSVPQGREVLEQAFTSRAKAIRGE